MKLTRSFVAIMAIAALTACDDEDDPTDEGDPNIAGDYDVSEFRYTDDDNPAITFNLSSLTPPNGPLGITQMTVAADNSFEGTLVLPEFGAIDIGGDIEFTGDDDEVRIDFDAATDAIGALDDFEDGTLELSGNTITIVLPDVTFNFSDLNPAWPDEDAEADLRIVGTRS